MEKPLNLGRLSIVSGNMGKLSSSPVFLLLLLLLGSCALPGPLARLLDKDPLGYYLEGTKEERRQMKIFLTALEGEKDSETSYALVQQIVQALQRAGRTDKMNLFLTSHVENNQNDPFNGHYLYLVASNYINEGAYPFAVHYFERILKNHEDLLIKNLSIHYLCLINLTKLVDDPAARSEYYKELLVRFGPYQEYIPVPMEVDQGRAYYDLAQTYEQLGEWDLAMQAYKNYLKHPDTVIPETPKAYKEVSEKVAFHEYRNKSWTYADLEELKGRIQRAIAAKNPRQVDRYRAKVNFFLRSWEQQADLGTQAISDFFSDLGVFMSRRLSYRRSLDSDSNSQEAYLETFGWSHRIPTWYLYFRKVAYPANPEINGQWEWAGIYFGEKPFSGTD